MDRTSDVRLVPRDLATAMTTTQRHGEEEVRYDRWTATVAVRIPRNGGADLETAAAGRLERSPELETVEIRTLAGIEPALAATIAQFDIGIETSTTLDRTAVKEELEQAPGTERVETLTPMQ